MSLPSTSDPQAGSPCPFLGGGTGLRGQAGHVSSFSAFAYFASACIPLAKAGSMGKPDVKGGKVTPLSLRQRHRHGCVILPQGSEAPSWKFNLPH